MPRTRPPYPPEFRRQAVELLRSGTPLKQVAAELGVSEQTLRNWRRQGDIDAGRAEGLTSDEREELRRLRRANRRLSQEREILKVGYDASVARDGTHRYVRHRRRAPDRVTARSTPPGRTCCGSSAREDEATSWPRARR
jgi:transposase